MSDELRREVRFEPVIGNENLYARFILWGPEGAVSFSMRFATRPGGESGGIEVGYHSHVPRGSTTEADCDLLPGGRCHTDGSFLQGRDLGRTLIEQGGDALWEALERRYDDWLRPTGAV